jgi:hypothetical protein
MGESTLEIHRDTRTLPLSRSVFDLDYLGALVERLDGSDGRHHKKSREGRIRKLTKRCERDALRLRWVYLLDDHQPLTGAEQTELSMLSRIFGASTKTGSDAVSRDS